MGLITLNKNYMEHISTSLKTYPETYDNAMISIFDFIKFHFQI